MRRHAGGLVDRDQRGGLVQEGHRRGRVGDQVALARHDRYPRPRGQGRACPQAPAGDAHQAGREAAPGLPDADPQLAAHERVQARARFLGGDALVVLAAAHFFFAEGLLVGLPSGWVTFASPLVFSRSFALPSSFLPSSFAGGSKRGGGVARLAGLAWASSFFFGSNAGGVVARSATSFPDARSALPAIALPAATPFDGAAVPPRGTPVNPRSRRVAPAMPCATSRGGSPMGAYTTTFCPSRSSVLYEKRLLRARSPTVSPSRRPSLTS